MNTVRDLAIVFNAENPPFSMRANLQLRSEELFRVYTNVDTLLPKLEEGNMHYINRFTEEDVVIPTLNSNVARST